MRREKREMHCTYTSRFQQETCKLNAYASTVSTETEYKQIYLHRQHAVFFLQTFHSNVLFWGNEPTNSGESYEKTKHSDQNVTSTPTTIQQQQKQKVWTYEHAYYYNIVHHYLNSLHYNYILQRKRDFIS